MSFRHLISITLGSLIFLTGTAQPDVHFSMAKFQVPGESPYVETFLHVNPYSITYEENESGMYQGKLEVTYAFYDQNREIEAYEKFEILTPEIAHLDSARQSFMDRKIIMIDEGKYDLEIELKDILGSDPKVSGSQSVYISFPDDTATISDIELVAEHSKKFTPGAMWEKNGMKIIPYIYDFYPDHISRISFYAELYNTHKTIGESPFVAKFGITDEQGKYLPDYVRYKRFPEAEKVKAMLNGFNITNLPTGNYFIRIDLIDSAQQIFASQSLSFMQINKSLAPEKAQNTNFERFAGYVDDMGIDTLSNYIKSLSPIAEQSDQSFINANHKQIKQDELRNFFVDFWLKQNPKDPAEAWFEYKNKVDRVNNTFGTRQVPGYETDRGYLYLRYGEPNTIVRRDNEPSNYPYHIWHYYDHPKRSDARYIFFNPELSTNEYRMLHSNVIGEFNNPKWRQQLSRRNTPFGSVDDDGRNDNFGNWADEFFMQPR